MELTPAHRNPLKPARRIVDIRGPSSTLTAANSAKMSHAASTTAYATEKTTDNETGRQLEPLSGLPMQRLRRDHPSGRDARFSRHDGVPLRQVQDFPYQDRNGYRKRPPRSDWNTGRLSWMSTTAHGVTAEAPCGRLRATPHIGALTNNG